MPSRGYRKGASDGREPLPCSVRTHLTERQFEVIVAVARTRAMTLSRLLRSIVEAHINGQRSSLPRPRFANAEALRQLARIGNNLNQLARQANAGVTPIDPAELRAVLARLAATLDRL